MHLDASAYDAIEKDGGAMRFCHGDVVHVAGEPSRTYRVIATDPRDRVVTLSTPSGVMRVPQESLRSAR